MTPMKTAAIRYSIRPSNPQGHLFEIRCAVTHPDPAGQRFALPAWIPGSYMIRDFARHVVAIRAEAHGKPVRLDKLDKHTWRAAPLVKSGTLTVISEVYAWDLSVRGAYLDQTHAFFNGSNVFLRALGHEQQPCLVDVQRPVGKACANWRIATAMAPAVGEQGAAACHGFGLYATADYDELIDHPLAMGTLTLTTFTACGVEHEVAISGRHDCDLARLCHDLTRICEWQIRFFGEPAPFHRYVFLITAVDDGYGGLEHRASTALLCARDDLPHAGMKGMPERYRTFLGLCSHEYFHTWNIKRIRPSAFKRYQLEGENYTTLLWAFEGFTSYYDELTLLRCGLIKRRQWLAALAKTIDRVQRDPGRHRQTLAESSFDAWIKYYRPDENTPNAVVSYYAKGALVALALDLILRTATDSRVSLDDVMRALWLRYGVDGEDRSAGVGDDDIRLLAEELSGVDLRRFFADAVHGTCELALARLFRPLGIKLKGTATHATPSLGVRTIHEGSEVRLATVYAHSPAQLAGLSAGDVLVAIDGLRVTPASWERLLSRRRVGDKIGIQAFRRDELLPFTVKLAAPDIDRHQLLVKSGRNTLRKLWLKG